MTEKNENIDPNIPAYSQHLTNYADTNGNTTDHDKKIAATRQREDLQVEELNK